MSGSPRILIARLSAIGDVVHSLPVLCALRSAMPSAHLSWVVEGAAGDLLEGHAALDELVRVPRRWLKSPRTVWQTRSRLRAIRPDLTIDVQGLLKSAVAAWLSGASRRIGLKGCDGRELSPWLNNELVEPTAVHIVDRNLELLTPLGIEQPAVEFQIPESAADARQAEETLDEVCVDRGYAVINTGAGWPSKRWCPDRFASVARHLAVEHGVPTLVVGGSQLERDWAESIVAESKGEAKLAPPVSLRVLAALLRRARLVVSADTGPLHIAAAVGTPCVALFGPIAHERNGPYGAEHIALQKARFEGTRRQLRQANNETTLAITVEDVTTACDEILARGVQWPRLFVA